METEVDFFLLLHSVCVGLWISCDGAPCGVIRKFILFVRLK
jgi:hypothetical protein